LIRCLKGGRNLWALIEADMRRELIYKVFFLVLMVGMTACGLPYCKKIKFDENDLLWLNPYEKDDTIIFVSNLDRFDTILVTAKDVYNPSNTFIFDLRGCNCWEGDNEFNAIAGFDLNFIDKDLIQENPNVTDGGFSINKVEKGKAAELSFSFCELYSRKITTDNDTSILLSNKLVSDCISIKKDECDIGQAQSKLNIQDFIWSKQFGLIQYTLETGEKYSYFKKNYKR